MLTVQVDALTDINLRSNVPQMPTLICVNLLRNANQIEFELHCLRVQTAIVESVLRSAAMS